MAKQAMQNRERIIEKERQRRGKEREREREREQWDLRSLDHLRPPLQLFMLFNPLAFNRSSNCYARRKGRENARIKK